MKDLRSMTVKQIKGYMKENNISVDRAYKMKKEELIVAIENGIKNEELFDPDKVYVFSKERYLDRIEHVNGKELKDSLLKDKDFMGWINKVDGQEVKQSKVLNHAYIDDEDNDFGRDVCIEKIEAATLENKEASTHPVDLNKVDEVKVDSGILNFIEDGTKVKVKLKDFKDKSKYFREDIGTLETDHLTGYKSVKIKNNYRTRHIPINNMNVDFFISKDDFMKFSLKLLEKEKIYKKSKKIVACRC